MVRAAIIAGILASWAIIVVLWFYLSDGAHFYCSPYGCDGWNPASVRIIILGLIVGLVLASWLAFTLAAAWPLRSREQSKPATGKATDKPPARLS
jgi:hypothetical protein